VFQTVAEPRKAHEPKLRQWRGSDSNKVA